MKEFHFSKWKIMKYYFELVWTCTHKDPVQWLKFDLLNGTKFEE